jgi:anaerobic selenocysteine-containing dehydrogenase
MARLAPEDTLLINPRDAREMAVRDGDSVLVESAGESRTYPVMLDRKVPPAVLYLLAHPGSAAPGRDPGAVRVAKVVGDAR